MLVALRRALDADPQAFQPERLARMTTAEAQQLWKGGSARIPLLNERNRMLNELGSVVERCFNGSFWSVVAKSAGDSEDLLCTIASSFPSFCDYAEYAGQPVRFWKRAQLLVADIHWLLEQRGLGGLRGHERLTACADYKVPQMLRDLGVLVYSPHLAAMVDGKQEIPRGSADEIEIRACTIDAVERIVEAYARLDVETTAIEVNDVLWLLGQRKVVGRSPYHRTRTVCY